MITLKKITKIYSPKKSRAFKAVDNVSFKLGDKGFVFLTGKSGSGKTTILNILGGLDKATSGGLDIDGTSIAALSTKELDAYRNTHLGFVFQEFNLIDDLSVSENVSLALELQSFKGNIEDKVKAALKSVGLADKYNSKTNELSGGQKQRVAIARALVKNPNLILVDEPTGNLDSESSIVVLDLLKKLSKDRLVVMVSHDTEYTKKYADRIIELKDGKILSDTESKKVKCIANSKLELKGAKLPFSSKFKMAINSILKNKLKISLSLVTLSSATVVYGASSAITSFDEVSAIENIMNKDSNQVFKISNGELNSSGSINTVTYTTSDIDELESKFSDSDFYKSNNTSGMFDLDKINAYRSDLYNPKAINRSIEVDDISDLGFEFAAGAMPTVGNEVVISDFIADHYIDQDSTKVEYSDIIGNSLADSTLVVSGIYQTNHEDYKILEGFKSVNDEELPVQEYGQWAQLKPILETLVINTGQYSELVSNGVVDSDEALNLPEIELFVNPQTNSSELFKFLEDNYNIIHSPKIGYIQTFVEGYSSISDIMIYISIALSVFASVLFFNNVSSSILDKKKEIGTLRALGTTGKDVSKIFLLESIIIVMTTLVISMIGLPIALMFINSQTASIIGYSINLFKINLSIILMIIGACLIIGTLTSIIPSTKISTMKPIDAIKK